MANQYSVVDITGNKYNRLTVEKFHSTKNQKRLWLCKCECGKYVIVSTNCITGGNTKSCGCYKMDNLIKRVTTHNKSYSREFFIYNNMVSRCTNPKNKCFDRYGGRGITVCDEWKTFEAFYKDMGNVPPLYTLERIENDKGYYKENCRWATRKEQCYNRSSNHFDFLNGVKLTVTEIYTEIGISRSTYWKYNTKFGYTPDQIFELFSLNKQ